MKIYKYYGYKQLRNKKWLLHFTALRDIIFETEADLIAFIDNLK